MDAWKIRSKVLLINRPLIVGILNITPDSFYDGGRFASKEAAVAQALKLVEEGADILDLGAESTKLGALAVTEQEELDRLIPVLKVLSKKIEIPISIDTTKARVAQESLKAGAEIINDVSALQSDPQMAEVVREYGAGIILMHRRGDSKTMQSLATYQDVIAEVKSELSERMREAIQAGISEEQIVIDPGIGFAKNTEQNFEILRRLSEFKEFKRPIFVGPSRKTFIGSVTNEPPEGRLAGTLAACVMAVQNGARLLRVHDVKPVKEALMVVENIVKDSEKGV